MQRPNPNPNPNPNPSSNPNPNPTPTPTPKQVRLDPGTVANYDKWQEGLMNAVEQHSTFS